MQNQESDLYDKIGIIELSGHIEVLRDVFFAVQESAKEVWVFTSNDIYINLQPIESYPDHLCWKIRPRNQSRKDFLYDQEELISTCDIVFLLTATLPFRDYSHLGFLNRTVVLIHNVHTFLQPWKHIAWSSIMRSDLILRIFRFYVLGEYFYLQRLLRKTPIWAFPSRTVLEYAHANNLIPVHQKTICLPLGLLQDTIPQNQESGPLRICIPGTIKSLGRDYKLVYLTLRKLLSQVTTEIELILLGLPKGRYGASMQKLFGQIQTEFSHFRVTAFDKTLDQREYDLHLKESDFLILPLAPLKPYDAFWESVGYSTISGAVHDMTRFGIPAIIPSFYPLEPLSELLVKRFKDEQHLLKILLAWTVSKKYRELRYNYYRQENAHKERRKSWGTQCLMLRDVSIK